MSQASRIACAASGVAKARPPWSQMARLCQKPDYRTQGSWMARRVARPLAQAITWILAPWEVNPHLMTVLAWAVLLGSSVAWGTGHSWGVLVGGLGLQLWYLLDHVDGQLARLQRRERLEGVLLDYLMHLSFWVWVPWGVGVGLWLRLQQPLWLLAAAAWSWGELMLHSTSPMRYPAMFKRLKRTSGPLLLRQILPREHRSREAPRGLLKRVFCWGRRGLETPAVMNALGLLALASWAVDEQWLAVRIYCGVLALAAPAAAVVVLFREVLLERTQAEFRRWFQVPPGHRVRYAPGCWTVVPQQEPSSGNSPRQPPTSQTLRMPDKQAA